jgi:diguanylate cyclase (GGDEF)-like protein
MSTIYYYVELNLLCIIILGMFQSQMHFKAFQLTESGIVRNRLIFTTILLCVFDMCAGILRGLFFPGARMLIEVSNLCYDEAILVISYQWMLYVGIELRIEKMRTKRTSFLLSIPLLCFTVVAIMNPWTHFLFTIDAGNLYVRGAGVFFHWGVTWFYMVLSTVVVLRAYVKEKNRLRKQQEIMPLLLFIIAPVVASILQMLFYGLSSIQVGVTISIVMICLFLQSNQILTDALTGLNNRRSFEHYLDEYLAHSTGTRLTLLMIDIDHFKLVNDKFGHDAGDDALCKVANLLKDVCREFSERHFLCRYGGDEFVIALAGQNDEYIQKFEMYVREGFRKRVPVKGELYKLSVSIGYATAICASNEDIEELLRRSDKAMYVDKKKKMKG